MNITSQAQFDELTKLEKSYRLKRKFEYTLTSTRYHGLTHNASLRLMFVSYFEAVPNILAESTLNTFQKFWLNSVAGKQLATDFDSSQPWLWQWNLAQQKYIKSSDPLTFDELYFHMLVAEKAAVIDIMLNRIQNYRRLFSHDYLHQREIYRLKAIEARKILDDGITEMNGDFPFTEAYAELEGFDLQTAAQSINLQDKFFQSKMVNTESLRLKYLRQIKDCTDIQQIHPILNDFYKQGELYAKH
jgi:hypothetical protein